MKGFLRSPYVGLVTTGMTASIALLIESRLDVSQDVHFLLELAWVGVIGAALLAFALMPTLRTTMAVPLPIDEIDTDDCTTVTAEFLDEDRAWLQAHPDSKWNEQE